MAEFLSDSAGLTNAITLVGGVGVVAGAQIIARFAIEPIYEQCRVIGEVAALLVAYEDLYNKPADNPLEQRRDAGTPLTRQAGDLRGRSHGIPCYRLCEVLAAVPHRRMVSVVEKRLATLSVGIDSRKGHTEKQRAPRQVEKALGIGR